MKINDNTSDYVLTFKELREFKNKLDIDFDTAKTSNNMVNFSKLLDKIEHFINSCDLLLNSDASQNNPRKKYAQKTINQIEDWVDEWGETASMILRGKIKSKRNILTVFSAVGKFILLRNRREYSDNDLPSLLPSRYVPQNKTSPISSYRDYSDSDVPEYTSG